jgi:hypothetical protein
MKYQTMINIIAGAGLILGPHAVTASDFSGGWAHDPNTGTFYHTNLPRVEQASGSGEHHSDSHSNDFGGGWAHDPNTGTFYHTKLPRIEQASGSGERHSDSHSNNFAGGWAHDEHTGTYYLTRHL